MTPITLVTLPIVPVRGTVAFPHTNFRIDCISKQTLLAYGDALTEEQDVLLLSQKDMLQDEPQADDFFAYGTYAHIKSVISNPDGTKSIVFECLCRAVALDVLPGEHYFSAVVQMVEEEPLAPNEDLADDITTLRELVHAYERFFPEAARKAYLAVVAMENVDQVVYFVASSLLADYRLKAELLSISTAAKRLEHLIMALQIEFAKLQLEEEIQQSVKANLEESQREYYLREQMKAIQSELGDDEDDEIKEYAERIASLQLPSYVEAKLNKELARLAKTPFGAPESTVLRNYLDICLDIPWTVKDTSPVSVTEAQEALEADHYGLDKVKERILEYIAVRQIAPDVKGQILCLVGPPGVGKTSIAISVAKAMKRAYARISLGGIRDEADVRGHRKTYVGAMPGRFVDALTDAKTMNPVIILDEIDKLSASQMGNPASALLEVLDPEQNQSFRDHYTELPMDLSDCVFIATANYFDSIPAPLLDRMEVIELSSYTEGEKFHIATKHLVPKQIKNHGLTDEQLHFSDSGIYEIIRHYTKEAGVRELERRIAAVCRKTARKIAEGNETTVLFVQENAQQFLGSPKFFSEELSPVDQVGVVNGLAYTTTGGELLKVEVLVMEGTGKVELTGSLGSVMKESAQIAISYVRSIAAKFSIPLDFYSKKDLHIHFPEGAVPKDGPSAGIAMTVAIVSALTGIPCRRDIAMTGEVTLRGAVLPIGGLKEKTMAAYKAGIQTVIIPKKNGMDLDEIDSVVKEALHFTLCDTMDDVLALALNYGKGEVT